MSEKLRESVSAMIDGEANELELRRVLSESSEDNVDILRSTWSRYHTIKDILQSTDQQLQFKRWDISLKVSDAITNENIASVKVGSSWKRPVSSFAVAASVAFAVVIGVQNFKPSDAISDPTSFSAQTNVAQSSASQSSVPSRVYLSQSSSLKASGNMLVGANYGAQGDLPGAIATSKAAADLEAQKRLEKYILRHTERAALNNGKGMISFARVASFENK